VTERVDIVRTFTGTTGMRKTIEPYISRGKGSLPVPSPRPARGQRLEYGWTTAGFEAKDGHITWYERKR